MKLPRIMITAPASGTGKTLLTCGLLQALEERKKKVCAFKCGPDYIDPMFHRQVIGIPSYNLDTFLASEKVVKSLLSEHGKGMDIAVMEGVMGYYDGLGGTSHEGSSFHVGRVTKTPAILVITCRGQSLSAAAQVKGFMGFREDSRIRGVILNKTGESMFKLLAPAIETECGIPVIGYLPELPELNIESRHLGLVLPEEIDGIKAKLHRFAAELEKTVDIDKLIEIAERAEDVEEPSDREEPGADGDCPEPDFEGIRIAVAKDEAFCFIYEDNLEVLRKLGAEILYFSPIHDEVLPQNADGLLLYGGYPELHGRALSENQSMLNSIAGAIKSGLPCIAECGGFIYLHREFEDDKGVLRRGVGVVDGRAFRTERLTRFGYINIYSEKDGILSCKHGDKPLRAHEFHYYDSQSNGDSCTATKPSGTRSWKCIHQEGNLTAGFPHFYYRGSPQVAVNFLKQCRKEREGLKDA